MSNINDETIKTKANELSKWFWLDRGEKEENRVCFDYMFVVSDGFDPDLPEKRQRKMSSKSKVSNAKLSDVLKIQNKIGVIIEEAVEIFKESKSVERIQNYLKEKQGIWGNITFADSCECFEKYLIEKFKSGDNFIDINQSWNVNGKNIGVCYTSHSEIEGYF